MNRLVFAASAMALFALLSVDAECLQTADAIKLSADSLVAHIDAYRDATVEVEGLVMHVCGVDGRKMKLMTERGAIIEILPRDSSAAFDMSLHKKRIRVRGIAGESRVGGDYIEQMEKDRALLCHIDNTPCKDTSWVRRQVESGAADTLSAQSIEKLKKRMEQTGKDYVPVTIIFAEEVEIIGEPASK